MTYISNPKLPSPWQRQIIRGTILGGSSIVKPPKGRNCYLFMRSCNRTWLAYKAEELKDLASQKPITKEANTSRWHSSCWPIFNEFREMFYKDGKKIITKEVFDGEEPLRDIGWAIWYGDSGKLEKNRVILNTHHFGLESSKVVVSYLDTCNIESEVWMQNDKYRVRLSEAGSIRLLRTIAHRLPKFMYHKLT